MNSSYGVSVLGLFVSCVLIASCGPPLGVYNVDDARIVSHNPAKPELREAHLEVRLSSSTDLTQMDGRGAGLYVSADPCEDAGRGLIFTVPYTPAGEEVAVADLQMSPNEDGSFHYFTYFPVARALADPNWPEKVGYDLRKSRTDWCVMLHMPGYYVTKSRSKVARLRVEQINAAYKELKAGARIPSPIVPDIIL
jgi:hypothetical protein